MKRKRNKIWIILLAAIPILAIAVLTLQDEASTRELTEKFTIWANRIMPQRMVENGLLSYKNIRRIAHIIEYGVLGTIIAIAVKAVGNDNSAMWQRILLVIAICFGVSMLDQTAKATLADNREFEVLDLYLDFIGYSCAAVIVNLIQAIADLIISRTFGKKSGKRYVN